MYKYITVFILIFALFLLLSQDNNPSRGSIPEELLRPARGESPRYPLDIVIGELGRGGASAAAYFYANSVGTGLLSGQTGHPSLSSVSPDLRESYLSALKVVSPVNFRIGGGREEADGAVSFLVRFMGREQGITGELYIRYITRQIDGDDGEIRTVGNWVFEELLLDEPMDRSAENNRSVYRNDFNPYERFF
ncbi:MAG: hypothetical protein LBG94_06695 [Treponema sp.]|jgi:hypothetical protein|nr:hypothetical protein [Treponema sp.]